MWVRRRSFRLCAACANSPLAVDTVHTADATSPVLLLTTSHTIFKGKSSPSKAWLLMFLVMEKVWSELDGSPSIRTACNSMVRSMLRPDANQAFLKRERIVAPSKNSRPTHWRKNGNGGNSTGDC